MNAHALRGMPHLLLQGLAAATLAAALLLHSASFAGAQAAWADKPERTTKGDVEFALTPDASSKGSFRVNFVVTTHSVELSGIDLLQSVQLHVDGRVLAPTKAPRLRGHHGRGRLEFALERAPQAFEIRILGVPGAGDVALRWP